MRIHGDCSTKRTGHRAWLVTAWLEPSKSFSLVTLKFLACNTIKSNFPLLQQPNIAPTFAPHTKNLQIEPLSSGMFKNADGLLGFLRGKIENTKG
jgi:hypothetical protein